MWRGRNSSLSTFTLVPTLCQHSGSLTCITFYVLLTPVCISPTPCMLDRSLEPRHLEQMWTHLSLSLTLSLSRCSRVTTLWGVRQTVQLGRARPNTLLLLWDALVVCTYICIGVGVSKLRRRHPLSVDSICLFTLFGFSPSILCTQLCVSGNCCPAVGPISRKKGNQNVFL